MTEEGEDTGRATSPYHEKCFPPYCDSAGSPIDKQMISKMKRDDLEDRYIVYADENLTLKRQVRNHERLIQRLQTALLRQDNLDKRGGVKVPASVQYGNARVDSLESQNKHLQAKVKVLRQQLMNHSFIHSKANRISENKEKQSKQDFSTLSFRSVGQTQSAREAKPYPYKGQSPSQSGKDINDSSLRERIIELENLMEMQKDKYKSRIAQLEKDLAALGKSGTDLSVELNEHSRKVSDNVEIIRMRRQTKKLLAEVVALNAQCEAAEKEISELRLALKQAKENAEGIEGQLERERERNRDAQSHLTKSVSHTETIRSMEEQIRDLQNERKTLKETNEQLLSITSGTPSKSDRSLQEKKLKQQISMLELKLKEKIKELEEKEEELIKLETLIKEAESRAVTQELRSEGESISQQENDLQPLLKSVSSSKTTSTSKKVYFKDNEETDCTDLKEQLCSALIENQKLRRALEDCDKDGDGDLRKENEKLESRLTKALQELELLRPIVAEHENCSKSRPQSAHTPSFGSVPPSEENALKVSTDSAVQQESKKKWPDPKTVIIYSRSHKVPLIPSRMHLIKFSSEDEFQSHEDLKKAQPKTLTASSAMDVAKEPPSLTPSLDNVKRLLERRRLPDSHPVKSDASVPSVDLQRKLEQASEEEDGRRTPPPPEETYSAHYVEEVSISEPTQKPILIIVSKHEFDAVLLKKKTYYSQSEVYLPANEQKSLSCKFEICVYNLEVDNRMLDYMMDIDKAPMVYVKWSFLGLEQRTMSMPPSQAHFHTNVAYYGPLSENMAEHVKERAMSVQLMLEKSSGSAIKIGEGSLDLSPAMENPSRRYLRCINLSGDRGSATVYCSFKLHDCREGIMDSPSIETLEVGIGHMILKSCDIIPNPEATHLYVEYSLLGHCGPELETDSLPKGEVMRFNHTKRLRVNVDNAPHLESMLQTDNPTLLKFVVLSEPCNLVCNTEVVEVGHAEVNLLQEMVLKDQDIISAQVPVFSNNGEELGSLSVTVIGVSTLHNHAEPKQQY